MSDRGKCVANKKGKECGHVAKRIELPKGGPAFFFSEEGAGPLDACPSCGVPYSRETFAADAAVHP